MTRWRTLLGGRVEVRPWESLPLTWRPGQHITAIAQTGHGKSTLLANVASLRTYVAVMATKPRDATLSRLYPSPPFHDTPDWPGRGYKILLWPRLVDLSAESTDRQAAAIRAALNGAFADGGWTIVVDELHHLSDNAGLGLRAELSNLWRMGRSSQVSVLAATQRPAHVPLEAYSQASHVFISRLPDRRDVDRVAEATSVLDRDALRVLVPRLPKHSWLYMRIDGAYACITRPPRYPEWPTGTADAPPDE